MGKDNSISFSYAECHYLHALVKKEYLKYDGLIQKDILEKIHLEMKRLNDSLGNSTK